MILDKLLEFDPDNTAITATAVSTNTLDMLNQRDMGADMDLLIDITAQATFTAAGAATLTVQLQGSTDNSTWVTLTQTDAIPKANLAVGTKIAMPLGMKASNPSFNALGYPRYYRLNYVVATGPFTTGQVKSELVLTRQEAQTYAAGVNVLN